MLLAQRSTPRFGFSFIDVRSGPPNVPSSRDAHRRWESVGRGSWGVRSRVGLSRHRALPERIGASRLKPQIVQ